MNKKISLGTALSLMAIVAAITFILTTTFSLDIYNRTVSNVKERAEVYKKLDEIDAYVRANYYGTTDEQALINALANGYAEVLGDKYAIYFKPSEYTIVKNARSGVITGIGVSTVEDGGYVLITEVVANSPASSMGLTVGEHIVKIGGEDILSMGYEEAVAKLSGEAGTNLTLTVRNTGVDRDLVVARAEISIVSVSHRLIGEIGYIQISAFNDRTSNQFRQAVQTLTDNGAKAIAIDVRNVSSSHLTSAIAVLDQILPECNFAVSVGADGTPTVIGSSDAVQIKLPFAVLVNAGTGGAGELLACAIRDFDKGVLIGTTTLGRGVCEGFFECLDGSAITFTTGILRTTRSETFNLIGLKPNYEVAMSNDSKEALALLDETTDGALKKAVDYLTTAITTK